MWRWCSMLRMISDRFEMPQTVGIEPDGVVRLDHQDPPRVYGRGDRYWPIVPHARRARSGADHLRHLLVVVGDLELTRREDVLLVAARALGAGELRRRC